jgi:hypothetical protein
LDQDQRRANVIGSFAPDATLEHREPTVV